MGKAREVVDRYYEAFAAGDAAAVAAFYGPDCITVTPAGSMNTAEHEGFVRAFKEALPDGHMEIIRAVESGDEIYLTGRFKGTHKGDLVSPRGTVPASGNALDMPFADYFRIVDGKIVEHDVVWDQLGMMAQLGAMPPS